MVLKVQCAHQTYTYLKRFSILHSVAYFPWVLFLRLVEYMGFPKNSKRYQGAV